MIFLVHHYSIITCTHHLCPNIEKDDAVHHIFAHKQFSNWSILEQNHTTRRKEGPVTSIMMAGRWPYFLHPKPCLAEYCAGLPLTSTNGGRSSYSNISSSSMVGWWCWPQDSVEYQMKPMDVAYSNIQDT